jgi:hypothetical protein
MSAALMQALEWLLKLAAVPRLNAFLSSSQRARGLIYPRPLPDTSIWSSVTEMRLAIAGLPRRWSPHFAGCGQY